MIRQPQAPLSWAFWNGCERLSKGVNDGPPPSSFWLTDKLPRYRKRQAGEVGTASHIWLEQVGRSLQPGVSKAVDLGHRDVRATCMEGAANAGGDTYPDHPK